MNRWGKLLLVATSVTPIFFVCFASSLSQKRWEDAWIYLALFAALSLLFTYMFRTIRSKLPEMPLKTTKVKPADKEVLAFLLSYLLPLFFKDNFHFAGEQITAILVATVIAFTIYYSTAYTFNPLLAFMGYHFYEVESEGMTYLLISNNRLFRPDNDLVVKHLCDYIYIETKVEETAK